MTHPKRLMLVDINILGIGSMRQWAYSDRTFAGNATGAIHGTLDKLFALTSEFGDHVPVVLWDDRCRWREQILPTYKRHRWETPEQQAFLRSYLAQAQIVRQLIGELGLLQLSCPDFEADDLAGIICRDVDPEWEVVLATSDTDWYQAIRRNVTWFSPGSGKRITVDDLGNTELIKEGPFHSTDHYVNSKALAGDSSDGIPGVAGVGLKTAAKIIREHGSVEELWAQHNAGVPIKGVARQRAAGPDTREIYHRNLRLIDWRRAPPLPADYELQLNPGDRAAYRRTCEAWGLVEHADAPEATACLAQDTADAGMVVGRILAAASRRRA